MKILDICDDSYLDIKRIFYTVEIGNDKVVDVMVANNGSLVYVMQNSDGSTVYSATLGTDNTFPNHRYDEKQVCSLVLDAYMKEFKGE